MLPLRAVAQSSPLIGAACLRENRRFIQAISHDTAFRKRQTADAAIISWPSAPPEWQGLALIDEACRDDTASGNVQRQRWRRVADAFLAVSDFFDWPLSESDESPQSRSLFLRSSTRRHRTNCMLSILGQVAPPIRSASPWSFEAHQLKSPARPAVRGLVTRFRFCGRSSFSPVDRAARSLCYTVRPRRGDGPP